MNKERRTAHVEAQSPQQAVIKFRHTQPKPHADQHQSNCVLGVSAESEPDELTG
jgi:hypothetical protein